MNTTTTVTTTTTAAPMTRPRGVERLIVGRATSDGDGVKLTRVLAGDLQRRLDPYLMLDAFGTDNPGDYIGGFPAHPHRGFETITYMLQGRMRHRDSAGNTGLLQPGSVQWMTAGRGVIHSEMPEQADGAMEGFQFWLNLPARDKLCEPWYRDIAPHELPRWTAAGATVLVIAGQSHGVAGAVQREHTQPLILDVHLEPGATLQQAVPEGHHAFVYTYWGALAVAGTDVPRQRMAILAQTPGADHVQLQAGADGARALLVAGRPLREPIAQHGPFVMNTQQELITAVQDFQAGRLAPQIGPQFAQR